MFSVTLVACFGMILLGATQVINGIMNGLRAIQERRQMKNAETESET